MDLFMKVAFSIIILLLCVYTLSEVSKTSSCVNAAIDSLQGKTVNVSDSKGCL